MMYGEKQKTWVENSDDWQLCITPNGFLVEKKDKLLSKKYFKSKGQKIFQNRWKHQKEDFIRPRNPK